MLNKKYQRFIRVLVGFSFIFIFTTAYSVQAQPAKNFKSKSDLKLLITDRKTGKHLANKDVEIHSDNGVRCIKAPCPTNSKNWTGKTDRQGYIIVPNDIRQVSMSLTIDGYNSEELNRAARKLTKDRWVISLKTD